MVVMAVVVTVTVVMEVVAQERVHVHECVLVVLCSVCGYALRVCKRTCLRVCAAPVFSPSSKRGTASAALRPTHSPACLAQTD